MEGIKKITDSWPKLVIDLGKLKKNAETINGICERRQISCCGVTKAVQGSPILSHAMTDGGISILGDSRIENIIRQCRADITSEKWLLRSPCLSQCDIVSKYADVSLNSELTVIDKLSHCIEDQGLPPHRVILMAEFGDLREGVMIEEISNTSQSILERDGVELYGLGTNFACLCGVIPTQQAMTDLSNLAVQIEDDLGMELKVISGGNSANIPLLLSDDCDFGQVNNLRIGEGILLGRDTVAHSVIPNTHQDVFMLESEVIEHQFKPNTPFGDRINTNGLGDPIKETDDPDVSLSYRIILALGTQDVGPAYGLTPVDSRVKILSSCSDHTVIEDPEDVYSVGNIMKLLPSYNAVANACSSEFVHKFIKASDHISF